jgi:U3 small nucleolar RNA-associated protein 23
MNAQTEEQDLHLKPSDLAIVGESKAEPAKKKRRGPKGPNPLSMKKKQVLRLSPDNRDTRVGEKRKRDVLDTEEQNDDMVAASANATTKRRRRRKHTIADNVQLTSSEISK